MDKIRVLIADDQNIIRWGLIAVLTGNDKIQVVGEAQNGLDVLEKTRLLKPDVILMDLLMPELDGISAIKLIMRDNPSIKILVLTSYDDENNIIEAINAGAIGFLSKKLDQEKLFHAIESAYFGNLSISQELTYQLFGKISKRQEKDVKINQLTNREKEVLELLGDGLTNQEIADKLLISKSTVRTHVSSLLRKLDLHNRVKIVSFANREGFVKEKI